MAEQVAITAQSLHWEDWERYSTRQEDRMKLDGMVGSIRYTGPLDPFLPYLRLGEYIHVGKNTAFGLGQMAVSVC
jgi:CRISPR/Cas system endoribonuclease Cas6 (RAMP superfamily)